MKLDKHEKVDILPWNRGYNEKPINLRSVVDVASWCREMHRYRAEPNSTSLIDRWNIGIYQLTYIPALCIYHEPREFGEAVASVFIHMIGCFENCGVETYEYIDFDTPYENTVKEIYRYICTKIPVITQQIYYKGKQRTNRFDIKKMEGQAGLMIMALIRINNAYKDNLPFEDSLMLAMAKVQDREFKTHG